MVRAHGILRKWNRTGRGENAEMTYQEDAGQADAGSREKDRLDKEGHVAKAVALTVDVISPPSSRPPHR